MKRTLFLNMCVTAAMALTFVGCKPQGASTAKPAAPAKVEKVPQETEIATITLTAEAAQRLGIRTTPVVREKIGRRRTFGGETVIPTGRAIIVSAPVPATVAVTQNNSLPIPGQRLGLGDPVLTLVPLLSPERYVPSPAERVQMANARATLLSALTVAQGDVEQAKTALVAAQIALDRAEKLLAGMAGSKMAVDDARARRDLAQASLKAAQDREQQLAKLAADLESTETNGVAASLVMRAPETGVLRSLAVSRGQAVTAGTMLFEVVNTDTMWIRVPVYVDMLADVRTDVDANIIGLDGRTTFKSRAARPVAAPPTADPLGTTADLYFETDNKDASLRPGQRVGVELALQGEQERLIVPAASILYDIYGGTWVYTTHAEHVFQRHRVLIQFAVDSRNVLAEGPPPGTLVVTDGAAELFGTEFGVGK